MEDCAHDPHVREYGGVELTADPEAAVQGSDCLVIVTKHRGYYELDLEHAGRLMRTAVIVDGRNVFDAKVCREAGFVYRGVGKG